VAGVALAAEAGDDGVDRRARLPALTGPWIAGEVAVDRADLTFSRQPTPDGPFDDLQLSLQVDDALDTRPLLGRNGTSVTSGDCAAAGDCTARTLGGVTKVVYGRLAVLPAAGPENEPLNVPLAAQVFTGAAFEANPADSCTRYQAGQVALSAYTGNLTAGMTTVVSPAGTATLVNGVADSGNRLTLSPPGFGHEGTVDLTLDVPAWLEFDWHGTGLEDPAATAAFGRFRGHDRIIFWGERR
jgi:MSHA biogenesis protein MshQ